VRKTNKNPALKSDRRLYPLFAALLVIMAACGPDPFFIPVTSINGVPNTGTAGTPLTLTGMVSPGFASKNAIIWLVRDAGTTGASISGYILNTHASGTVLIRAVIVNGMAEGKHFIQDFLINIAENGSPPVPVTYYDVTFESNGGSAVASQRVKEGECAERPDDPEKADFGFDNWYSDSELTTVYNFNTPITGNITLYAKWVELISDIALYITGPMKGEIPDTTAVADGTVSYTIGAVSWEPNHNPFMGVTVYTATVTVTAHPGSKFTGTLTAEINGHSARITGRTDTTVTISYTFEPTLAKAVTSITINSQPVKTTYTHGDTLDLTGLSVKLIYDDDTSEIFALEHFGDIISENPANGSPLSHTAHNNQPVKVSAGRHNADTDKLTVNKAKPVITFPTASAITYGMTLAHSALTGGSSTPFGPFAWQDSAVIPPVINSGYPVEFTPTDTDDYDFSGVSGWDAAAGKVVRIVAITVNKAAGAAVAAPVITWNAGSRWIEVTAVTPPENGQTVEYNISTASNGAGLGTWQTGRNFTVSSAGTYYVYARSKENDNYNAGAASISAGLTVVNQNIGFEIKPGESPTVITNTGVVISRSGANGPQTVTLTVSSGYTNITWYYNDIELGTGTSLELDASNPAYNMIGLKFVRVEAWKDGVPYITNVEFEVKP